MSAMVAGSAPPPARESQWTAETYDLYDRHAWDHEQGGVFFDLAEDWSVTDSSKSAGHLLHAMEATSGMFAATADERYLRDLNRLCDTFVTRTFDPRTDC